MNNNVTTAQRDAALFLQIAGQGAGIESHGELWKWLRGDVQQWLPHDAMLVGWGDFASGQLQHDVLSGVPGLRTHDVSTGTLAPLLHFLRDCWAAAQQMPCHVDLDLCRQVLRDCPAPTRQAFAGMRTALVHGTRSARRGEEQIFAALSRDSSPSPGAAAAMKVLLPFIDCALRRIEPLPPCAGVAGEALRSPALLASLSEREREIMQWVALGKTNPEIGCILHISEFTVKNHMKSIFAKLDVTNRAQAVAKLTRLDAHA
jgi:transcriptional regulator EpsA